MNRLLHKAPKTVSIGGVDYDINTNFRDCLFTIIQMRDPTLTAEEKAEVLINNMYLEDPVDLKEAIEKALWFLRCGKENREKESEILCDFEQDHYYIFEAFHKAGINLDASDDMHWWIFMSHFSELPESFFSRLVYLRAQKSRGKLSKEERAEINRIGLDIVEIKDVLKETKDRAMRRFVQGEIGEAELEEILSTLQGV